MIKGAWAGLGLAVLILLVTYDSDWTASYTWVPYIFLAVIALGFSTWVGGLVRIQTPHKDLERFRVQLNKGKHILIVDIDPEQKANLDQIVQTFPRLKLAGDGDSTPRWVVMGQHSIKRFVTQTFP